MLETIDRVAMKPFSEGTAHDIGPLEPERLPDAIDLGQRLLINRNLYVLHMVICI